MKPKDYSIEEVYNNTSIGLIFEFYSSKEVSFIAEDLSKPLGKTVVVTGQETAMPSWTSSILLKEYNGKRPRYQLKIAQQDYLSIGPILEGVLEWISKNAALDYSTKLSVDLSFKHRNLQTLSTISNMDISKLILQIDENFIYNKFKGMKDSPFALSIKRLVPFKEFINISNPLSSISTSFQLPIAEYYGVDFTNQTMGNLRFNYIGGEKYASKKAEINETIKYYILTTYQSLNSSSYTLEMKHELSKLTENYSKMRRIYYDPDFFISEYGNDLKISIDLKKANQITKTFWSKIRNPLINLMMESDLKKGYLNWDSDLGVFELKDAKLSGVKVSHLNIINCEINGIIENCNIWGSTINNSRLNRSLLVAGNKVKSSLLEICRADRTNTIDRSYIINKGEIINCEVNESIIKNAGIGKNARLDEECTLIEDRVMSAPLHKEGIKVEEIRDYKWIKSMRSSITDSGYGNEFKINY